MPDLHGAGRAPLRTAGRGALHALPDGYGGVGWNDGSHYDYDREYCVGLARLSAFLHEIQPEVTEFLALGEDGPTRRRFLARLQVEVAKRGTVNMQRHGIKHGAQILDSLSGSAT